MIVCSLDEILSNLSKISSGFCPVCGSKMNYKVYKLEEKFYHLYKCTICSTSLVLVNSPSEEGEKHMIMFQINTTKISKKM